MLHKNQNRPVILFSLILLWLFALFSGLTACSSGGGDTSSAPLVYSGSTHPIAITETNAAELVSFLFGDNDLAGDVPLLPSSADTISTDEETIVVSAYLPGLAEIIRRISRSIPSGVLVPIDSTMECDSGVVTYSGSVDDETGTGTVVIVFDDCTNDGITMNGTGTMTFNAYDFTYNEFTDMTFSVPLVKITSATTTDIDASMSMVVHYELFIASNTERTTADVLVLDHKTEQMFKFENQVEENIYAPSVLFPVSYTQTIHGRYYDSTDGYFDVTTPSLSPLVYSSVVQSLPEDGGMQFSGDASTLHLDVESTTHIVLSLDSDGDQVFETVTTLLWHELDTDFAADIGDDDGDEMHNSWEVVYGLDPSNPADAVLDEDGDGTTNYQEYLDRTDPTSAT